jgi:hypothetical protein
MKDATSNPNGASQALPSKPSNDACEQDIENRTSAQPAVKKSDLVDTSPIKYSQRDTEKGTFHNK